MFTPPKTINVRDRHGGCTIETEKSRGPIHEKVGQTLWRPQSYLKESIGELIESSIDHKGFWQNHDNVTTAKYKVKGLRYPVVLWWDNVTGERYA